MDGTIPLEDGPLSNENLAKLRVSQIAITSGFCTRVGFHLSQEIFHHGHYPHDQGE